MHCCMLSDQFFLYHWLGGNDIAFMSSRGGGGGGGAPNKHSSIFEGPYAIRSKHQRAVVMVSELMLISEFDIRVGYNLDIMRQSACLVFNPITVYSYGFLFNCTTVGQASDSMTALT